MTSKEVIRANLRRERPVRIGLHFGGARLNDFCHVSYGPSPVWQQKSRLENGVEYFDDEWGNIWYRKPGMGRRGEVFKPALDEWSKLDDWKLPDMADPSRYADTARKIAETPDIYHCGGLPGFPFAVCRYLRKMENYFQDLLLERERIDILHSRVVSLLERMMEQYARSGVEGIFFCEDWGTQERLLVSPATWRKVFRPVFERLCATAHGLGLDVLMHSCGYIRDILPDLARAGINVFQFDQPGLYGLPYLSEELSRLKVCLWSPVDIQRVLPTGNRQIIEEEATRMVELFRGSFIAGGYPDLNGIGVKPEWDSWAYEAFVKAGVPEGTL